MSAIFPRSNQTARPAARAAAPPPVSRETHDAARRAVRDLLERTRSFGELAPDKREALAKGLVQIGSYLAEPDGMRLKPAQQSSQVRALADGASQTSQTGSNVGEDGKFAAQGAREGVAAAGALLQAVNFPEFCAGLINGVFHSIVQSSIEQMEAYAKLVADVSKSLSQFRDDNTTQNQGRDHLVEQFPDLFQISTGANDPFGGFGDMGMGFGDAPAAPPQPRVTLREGVDESAAVARLNQSLPLDQPIDRVDDDLVEALLVPAARTQLASSRQQLLATMVMLGISRIVVTNGKLSAKVMYDFQARDNMQFSRTAQQFDYGDASVTTESVANGEIRRSGPGQNIYRLPNGTVVEAKRDASFYTRGDYKSVSQPLIQMTSVTQTTGDASLTTKASLAGTMEVNFKSDYVPLEKLANPESIAAIQMNAQPGMVKTLATNRPAPAASAPASPASPPAPAATP
ncbi:hypothetical protein [Luteimonas aquatica]|uniref:hypothetical protein n=1 Tax=Luteimonas aquatica TaxID=450364 RepID=UPI001F596DE6|nr:hypothetical protein [Luteimonas aquatica]